MQVVTIIVCDGMTADLQGCSTRSGGGHSIIQYTVLYSTLNSAVTVAHSSTTVAGAAAAGAAVAKPTLGAMAALFEAAQHGKQPSLRRCGYEVSFTQKPHADRAHWVQSIHFIVRHVHM